MIGSPLGKWKAKSKKKKSKKKKDKRYRKPKICHLFLLAATPPTQISLFHSLPFPFQTLQQKKKKKSWLSLSWWRSTHDCRPFFTNLSERHERQTLITQMAWTTAPVTVESILAPSQLAAGSTTSAPDNADLGYGNPQWWAAPQCWRQAAVQESLEKRKKKKEGK